MNRPPALPGVTLTYSFQGIKQKGGILRENQRRNARRVSSFITLRASLAGPTPHQARLTQLGIVRNAQRDL